MLDSQFKNNLTKCVTKLLETWNLIMKIWLANKDEAIDWLEIAWILISILLFFIDFWIIFSELIIFHNLLQK